MYFKQLKEQVRIYERVLINETYLFSIILAWVRNKGIASLSSQDTTVMCTMCITEGNLRVFPSSHPFFL